MTNHPNRSKRYWINGDRVGAKRRIGSEVQTCYGTVIGLGPTGMTQVRLDSGEVYGYEDKELISEPAPPALKKLFRF